MKIKTHHAWNIVLSQGHHRPESDQTLQAQAEWLVERKRTREELVFADGQQAVLSVVIYCSNQMRF